MFWKPNGLMMCFQEPIVLQSEHHHHIYNCTHLLRAQSCSIRMGTGTLTSDFTPAVATGTMEARSRLISVSEIPGPLLWALSVECFQGSLHL